MLGLVYSESCEHQEAPKLDVGYNADKTFVVCEQASTPGNLGQRSFKPCIVRGNAVK